MDEQTTKQTPSPLDDNWAKPIDRLAAGNVPVGALDTASGKQVVSPIQGFGKMWQKTYRVALAGSSATPTCRAGEISIGLPSNRARACHAVHSASQST